MSRSDLQTRRVGNNICVNLRGKDYLFPITSSGEADIQSMLDRFNELRLSVEEIAWIRKFVSVSRLFSIEQEGSLVKVVFSHPSNAIQPYCQMRFPLLCPSDHWPRFEKLVLTEPMLIDWDRRMMEALPGYTVMFVAAELRRFYKESVGSQFVERIVPYNTDFIEFILSDETRFRIRSTDWEDLRKQLESGFAPVIKGFRIPVSSEQRTALKNFLWAYEVFQHASSSLSQV